MRRQVSDPVRDLPSESRSRPPILSIVMAMGVIAIFADLAMGGVLKTVDAAVADIWTFRGPYNYVVADIFDRIGQRLLCLPLLFGVAIYLCRRLDSLRPLVIALGGTLLLNFAIGLVKITTERQSPRTGGPDLFSGDNVLFPSGHTANVIFVYGLTVALLWRYGRISDRTGLLLSSGVVLTFAFMTFVSIYRHTHWLSDLLAGGMIGLAVLELTMRADSDWPFVRRRLRHWAGPAWMLVEMVVGRVRQVLVHPALPASLGGLRTGGPHREVALSDTAGRTAGRTGAGVRHVDRTMVRTRARSHSSLMSGEQSAGVVHEHESGSAGGRDQMRVG